MHSFKLNLIIILFLFLHYNLLHCVNFQLQTALLEKSKKTNYQQNNYNQPKSFIQPTQIKVVQIQRLFALLQEIRDSAQVLAGVFSDKIEENYKSCVRDIDEFNCTYESHWEFLQTKHEENMFEISKDIKFKEKLINEMKDLMLLEGWKKQQTLKTLFATIRDIEEDKAIVKEINNLLRATFSNNNIIRLEQIEQNEGMFLQLKSRLKSSKVADQISGHFTELKSLYSQSMDSNQLSINSNTIYPTGLNELFDCEDPAEYLSKSKLSLKEELNECPYFSFQQRSVKMIKNNDMEDDSFQEFIQEESFEKKDKESDQDKANFIQTSESLDIDWLKLQISDQAAILSQKIKKAFKLLQSNLQNEKIQKIEQIQTFKKDIKAAQDQHSLKIYDIQNQITHLNWKLMEKTDIIEDLHQKISDCKKQKEYLDTCQEIKNFDLAYLSSLDAVKSITMSAIDEIMEILQKDPEVSDIKFQILESNQILLQSQINNLVQELKFTNVNKNYRKQNAHQFLHTFGYQLNINENESNNNNSSISNDSNDNNSNSNNEEKEQLTKLAHNIIEKQKALSSNAKQDEDYIRNEKLLIQEELSMERPEQKDKKQKSIEKPKKPQQKEEVIPTIDFQEEIA